MAGKSLKLTRRELTSSIMEEFQVTKMHASDVIETILVELADALRRGEKVKISGLGVFCVLNKKERAGFNPKTGEAARVSGRKVVSFHPSTVFKARLNKAK
ncbi:MAG: HU family DNA-binding protein [Holosporales bacterium]|jgi:integration host factor subunit alpha|nr:HU family DNA-binding protein [Holosporales bacterium]